MDDSAPIALATPGKKAKRIAIAIELDHCVPWHHDCYQGIQQYANQAGWLCVVDPYLVGMTGQSGIADYDGVVGRINTEVAEAARAHDIPVVNHWANSPVDDLPSVLLDHRESARLASEHLLLSGYETFAHIGITNNRIGLLDVDGMHDVLATHGHDRPVHFEFVNDFETSREGVIHMRRVLTDWLKGLARPVGVFVQAVHNARYLAQICGELGLRVPHDVGIVVHQADAVIVSSVSPTLSAVDLDYFAVGYKSAKKLDNLMRGMADEPLKTYIAPKRLIVRESSDVYLSSDPMISQALRYMAENCRRTLRVEEVAEHLYTSRRTLERRFEENVGRSVYSEIRRLRTDHIRRMLLETDRPLATIADECGFSSVSHFTRYFRKQAGFTPGAFRKHHHNHSA